MMRALLVSYPFPPAAGVSVLRAVAFARHLSEYDVDVEVLTVEDPPSGLKGSKWLPGFLPYDLVVHRAWSDEPMRVLNGLRSVFTPRRIRSEDAPTSLEDSRSQLPRALVERFQANYVPDEKIGWLKYATNKGVSIVLERDIDIIISTGPPHTAHLVAQKISQLTDVPYAVDLRDPWAGNELLAKRTYLREQKNLSLERFCLAGASVITTVTPGMTTLYKNRYPHLEHRIHTVFNGYWAREAGRSLALAKKDPDRIVFSYVGDFQGGGHSPGSFLVGLAAALGHDLVSRSLLSVRFIGSDSSRIQPMVDTLQLSDVVTCLAPMHHADAMVEMASSDVLLYIQGEEEQFSLVLGGKFAEYLAIGRPILALVKPGGDADRILGGINRACVVPVDDPAHVALAIQDILNGQNVFRADAPRPEVPSLAWRDLMKTYARLLHDATGAA